MEDKKTYKRFCRSCDKLFQPTGKFNKICDPCRARRDAARKERCRCGGLKYKGSNKCINCYRSSNKRQHIKTPESLKLK